MPILRDHNVDDSSGFITIGDAEDAMARATLHQGLGQGPVIASRGSSIAKKAISSLWMKPIQGLQDPGFVGALREDIDADVAPDRVFISGVFTR